MNWYKQIKAQSQQRLYGYWIDENGQKFVVSGDGNDSHRITLRRLHPESSSLGYNWAYNRGWVRIRADSNGVCGVEGNRYTERQVASIASCFKDVPCSEVSVEFRNPMLATEVPVRSLYAFLMGKLRNTNTPSTPSQPATVQPQTFTPQPESEEIPF